MNAIANFVIDHLPRLLEEAPPTLAAAVHELGAEYADSTGLATAEIELLCLDLKMIETALVYSQQPVPEWLWRAVDDMSTAVGQPAVITYEEIVLLNPADQTRVFTRGAVGASERLFYRVHADIEQQLERLLVKLRQAHAAVLAGELPTDNWDTVAATLVLELMHELRRDMPPQHFAAFRPFLGSHPSRNLKGSSGAYTARIPELDLLLWGDQIGERHRGYLRDNLQYFPRAGRERILGLLDQPSLLTLIERQSAPHSPVAEAAAEFLLNFRAAHYRDVAHYIPEAIRDRIAGTGGEHAPGEFLRQLLKETRDLLNRPRPG